MWKVLNSIKAILFRDQQCHCLTSSALGWWCPIDINHVLRKNAKQRNTNTASVNIQLLASLLHLYCLEILYLRQTHSGFMRPPWIDTVHSPISSTDIQTHPSSTRSFQAFSHLDTVLAQCCLTSVVGIYLYKIGLQSTSWVWRHTFCTQLSVKH